jgi:hypothetical protein
MHAQTQVKNISTSLEGVVKHCTAVAPATILLQQLTHSSHQDAATSTGSTAAFEPTKLFLCAYTDVLLVLAESYIVKHANTGTGSTLCVNSVYTDASVLVFKVCGMHRAPLPIQE